MSGAEIMQLGDDGNSVAGPPTRIDCDCIAMSGGWNPTVHLFSQSRGRLTWDDAGAMFVPGAAPEINPSRSSGACNGTMDLPGCLREGAEAGADAARAAGFGDAQAEAMPSVARVAEQPLMPLWEVPSRGRVKKFHEFQNDSTADDLRLASREGYVSVEHTKRYTTTGMGTDQGKTSNVNAIGIMARTRGVPLPDVGTTTFRPNYTPVAFGAVAGLDVGPLFEQERGSAMHSWHIANGAVFEDVGDWKRPRYFPKNGEDMHAAVQRECRQTRQAVGVVDASTLGKIDIQGPDAARFLDMIYTNSWQRLVVGKCRYGLMLNEHGMIFDDGVTTRLAENHFHMTTTTGGAARVMNWLEEWLQTEWPEMKVYCTSVTEQWAVTSISGPHARDLLAELTDIDLAVDGFPFMSMREGTVAGVPARVYRISFTGEIAYEINVPQRWGLHLWEALMAHGEKYGLCPYGTETMHVLRAEKGFIIVGQDTDGTCTPMDVGMDWMVSRKKGDFLGRRSFARPDTVRAGRKQLVGILTDDPNIVLPEGAHLVAEARPEPPMEMLGHITSSYMSPNVGRSIALALVRDGRDRVGQSFTVPLIDGSRHKVTITDTVFVDREGERARG